MEIRALREADEPAPFHSGDSDLDRFLHRYAGQNQFRHHIGTTYVAAESDKWASGSFLWASNPAEIRINSGAN